MAAVRTIMRGRVVRLDPAANNLPWVTVPELGVERQIGPCPTIRGDVLAPGDSVLCLAMDGTHDDLTVIGKFGPPLEAVATFSELTDVDWSSVPSDGVGFVWDTASGKLVPHSSHLVSASEPPATGRRAGDLWIDPSAPVLPTPGAYGRTAQRVLRGGGRRYLGSGTLAWGKPFFTRGAGQKSHLAPSSYHEIAMPLLGTVIQKVGVSGQTATVTADAVYGNPVGRYVPLQPGESLWYALPLGSVFNANGTFYITAAAPTQDFEVPESWVLICSRNPNYPTVDRSSHVWGDGLEDSQWTAPTLLGTWVNYNVAAFSPAGWRKVNGIVYWRGLVANGAASSAICNLDPQINGNMQTGGANIGDIFSAVAGGAGGRVDAYPDRLMHILGGTSYVSLANVVYWNG